LPEKQVQEEKRQRDPRNDQKNAVKSIPAYLEKSDFVAIVAPGCLHADRRDPDTKLRTKTCYRTYRKRGWCVLEMMCSMLSRQKIYPALLITSAQETPEWVSSFDALKLAVGLCDFTCCQRNHIFNGRAVSCDRDITREILNTLIVSKVKDTFQKENIKLARLFEVMSSWWTRDSSSFYSSDQAKRCKTLLALKHQLKWDDCMDGQDENMPWIDRAGISLLFYAVGKNNLSILKEILKLYQDSRTQLLSWRFPKEGAVEVGIPGHITVLYGAMSFASPDFVVTLLDAGSIPYTTDIMGVDPLMAACAMGRLDNIKRWFERVKGWDIDRQNEIFGSTALHIAVYLGSGKYDLVRYLVCDVDYFLSVGAREHLSFFISLCVSLINTHPHIHTGTRQKG
jgi:hypothetical protein